MLRFHRLAEKSHAVTRRLPLRAVRKRSLSILVVGFAAIVLIRADIAPPVFASPQGSPSAGPVVAKPATRLAGDPSLSSGVAGREAASSPLRPRNPLHPTKNGDPHLITVDLTHYNFQGGGEYVDLLGSDGLQIQTRQTPVQTSTVRLINDPYDGVASCVSLDTAFAAQVGTHRVTFEPSIDGNPIASGMELRVDGVLQTLTSSGLSLSSGGRIVPSPVGSGIEVDFPDGAVAIVTMRLSVYGNLWVMDLSVFHTTAVAGLLGAVPAGTWLPSLPDGSTVGPMPSTIPQRYMELYQQFGDAWRVTNASSLFDYAPGTSTQTFTFPSWPLQSLPCRLPHSSEGPAKSGSKKIANKFCAVVSDKTDHGDCVFDLTMIDLPELGDLYAISGQIEAGATQTLVRDKGGQPENGAKVVYKVSVSTLSDDGNIPTGTIQITVDGVNVGVPVPLDANGHAKWVSKNGVVDNLVANYLPTPGSMFLPSSGVDVTQTGTTQ